MKAILLGENQWLFCDQVDPLELVEADEAANLATLI